MARPERRFLFRLALGLGMTVAELGQRMSSAELTEWMAFNNIEPFGPLGAWERAGVLAAIAVNTTPRKKGAKPVKPDDFFSVLKPPKRARASNADEQQGVFKKLASVMGHKG